VADIDVVKARSSSWIWWVIAAVAVVLLLMFLMRGNDANAPAQAPSSSAAPQQPSLLVA
jgi:hypothetical protein